MTTKAGLYMSSHEGCTIYAAHRHPREATQPRTITFEVRGTVTFEVVRRHGRDAARALCLVRRLCG